jgi:putative nucleotidyltransferase with HDIG domain
MTHLIDSFTYPYQGRGSQVIQKSHERWTGLSDLSHFLVGSDTFEELIKNASKYIIHLLGLDFCKILLLEQNGHFYFQDNEQLNFSLYKHQSDIGVARVAETALFNILRSTRIQKPSSNDQNLTIEERSALGLLPGDKFWLYPLKVESQELGFLFLGKREYRGETIMDEDSVYIVDLIADQLSNALHRTLQNEHLANLSIETVLALSKTLETRDSQAAMHSKRMANFAERIAQHYGYSVRETRELCWAAILHDIGKIGVEDQILKKPGPLTEKEWVVMRTHSEIGSEIVRGLTGLEKIAPIIKYHHERVDGTGYPKKLKREEIPLGARIISVIDSYAAMTESRVYRNPLSHESAIRELQKYSGIMYDPEIVDMFVNLFEVQTSE